jgi:glycosyltransferase involved in cell wall biosynthesis
MAVILLILFAVRELVIDGHTGVMVESGNAQSLKEAILDLTSNKEKRERLAANGREHVRNEFSIEVNAKRIASVFESILGY